MDSFRSTVMAEPAQDEGFVRRESGVGIIICVPVDFSDPIGSYLSQFVGTQVFFAGILFFQSACRCFTCFRAGFFSDNKKGIPVIGGAVFGQWSLLDISVWCFERLGLHGGSPAVSRAASRGGYLAG